MSTIIIQAVNSTRHREPNKNIRLTLENARHAFLDRLAELPDVISIYKFASLIRASHNQSELVLILYALQSEGRMEILVANELRQLRREADEAPEPPGKS